MIDLIWLSLIEDDVLEKFEVGLRFVQDREVKDLSSAYFVRDVVEILKIFCFDLV